MGAGIDQRSFVWGIGILPVMVFIGETWVNARLAQLASKQPRRLFSTLCILHLSFYTGIVVPGMATGYQPSASGFTGGSVSQSMTSGTSFSWLLNACSQVMTCPV